MAVSKLYKLDRDALNEHDWARTCSTSTRLDGVSPQLALSSKSGMVMLRPRAPDAGLQGQLCKQ
jgi:hypothetical protein